MLLFSAGISSREGGPHARVYKRKEEWTPQKGLRGKGSCVDSHFP